MADFKQRAADLSAEHPRVVAHYQVTHDIAEPYQLLSGAKFVFKGRNRFLTVAAPRKVLWLQRSLQSHERERV